MTELPTTADRPQRADARRNRARVLEAANECFRQKGTDAQMDDIADRAGVGVGTVYRHFPTKEALVAALAKERFARLAERARAGLEEPDPLKAFETFMWEAAEIQASDLGLSELQATDPCVMKQAGPHKHDLVVALEELIARAKDAGGLRADVSAGDVPMIMCALGGIMLAHQRGGPFADWKRFLELQLQGLRTP